MTVEVYELDLEMRLNALCDRVQNGQYRPQPVRRTYIPRADGGKRPLGIAALEDKIVQSAMAEMLSAIYEVDFHDRSYGFRPERSAHKALRTVHDAIMSERVNWVVDADIRQFFDSVDHGWLIRMLQHRIADRRVIRLIKLWLDAGVMEDGRVVKAVEGTPQGAGISPLLANIFLHYALDLWVQQWRGRNAQGRMRIVRYAADVLLSFEREFDARRMLVAMAERLAEFGVELNKTKTKLIEFGRYAYSNRQRRRLGKPETFNFLGFTHYCSTTQKGRFIVKRKTQSKRLNSKLKAMRQAMRKRMHWLLGEQRAWLSRVLKGHYVYYGVTGNMRCLGHFYHQITHAWYRVLMRRSQRRRLTWERFSKLMLVFPLPIPRIVHSWRYGIET